MEHNVVESINLRQRELDLIDREIKVRNLELSAELVGSSSRTWTFIHWIFSSPLSLAIVGGTGH